jgi:hypothetical protein
MNTKPNQEIFALIYSFAIKSRVYLISEMSEGEIKSTWFDIPLKNKKNVL